MDPDATLTSIRDLTRHILKAGGSTSLAEELADAFERLDTWISQGGFPPHPWRSEESDGS